MDTWTAKRQEELASKLSTESKIRFLIDSLKQTHWLNYQREWMEDQLVDLCDNHYFFLNSSLLKESLEALSLPNNIIVDILREYGAGDIL